MPLGAVLFGSGILDIVWLVEGSEEGSVDGSVVDVEEGWFEVWV